jgi:hypothetical protein
MKTLPTYSPHAFGAWAQRLSLLLVLLTASFVPSWAQEGSIQATLSTICLGGSTTLRYTGPIQPNTTYSWSPNRDINTAYGTTVVVNPAQTTTYTLSVVTTYPGGLASLTPYSYTVNVQQDCCQASVISENDRLPIELESTYDLSVAGTVSPFAGWPAGTYFHCAAPTLTLRGNSSSTAKFALPVGSVLLMEPGAEIILESSGTLELNASTITAVCNEMWKGITVRSTARLLDFHGVNLQSNTGSGLKPSGMRNRILHSMQGVVLEDGFDYPEFQINFTDFWHNYRSLDIDRRSSFGSYVRNKLTLCDFDSDPALMKSPYNVNGGASYYSDYHMRVAGDLNGAAPFENYYNSFHHCLVGILADRTRTALSLPSYTFSDFYIAGIYYAPGLTGTGTLAMRTFQSQALPTEFTFPAGATLPNTPQVNNARIAYNPGLPYGTAAIASGDVLVSVTGATFSHASPPDYNPAFLSRASYAHVGISTSNLGDVTNCQFIDLQNGIAHNLPANNLRATITQSFFGGCGWGYRVANLSGGRITAASSGTVKLECNTFARLSGELIRSRTASQYFGVYVEGNAHVKLTYTDSQTQQPAVLKNKFDDGGYGSTGFQAIYNANTNIPVQYKTFDDYWASPLASLVNAPYVSQVVSNVTYAGTSGMNCAPSGPRGLERVANATEPAPTATDHAGRLDQNVPNPAQAASRIGYQLPAQTKHAELLIRRALDGQLVDKRSVSMETPYIDLALKGYPAGTYFYTLVADGVPLATKRLVVE